MHVDTAAWKQRARSRHDVLFGAPPPSPRARFRLSSPPTVRCNRLLLLVSTPIRRSEKRRDAQNPWRVPRFSPSPYSSGGILFFQPRAATRHTIEGGTVMVRKLASRRAPSGRGPGGTAESITLRDDCATTVTVTAALTRLLSLSKSSTC